MHDNVLRDFSASSGTECIGFIYGCFKCSSQKSQFQGKYETKLKFN